MKAKIQKILTDNGKEKSAGSRFGHLWRPRRGESQRGDELFTDRFVTEGEGTPTPRSPRSKRPTVVERFNGRIADILIRISFPRHCGQRLPGEC
ncbi:MAG: hypothetical protein ACREYE_33090 [Gammaproteobacteria bacterium]